MQKQLLRRYKTTNVVDVGSTGNVSVRLSQYRVRQVYVRQKTDETGIVNIHFVTNTPTHIFNLKVDVHVYYLVDIV